MVSLEQLENFAEHTGIPAAKKLRRDELEKAIVAFLRTRKGALPTKRSLRKTAVKDVDVFSDGPFQGRCQAANGL